MNFFPIVEGFPREIKSGITYSLCSNGIFEIRALPGGGYVSTKIDGIKGLPEGKEEIRFLKKKIPMQLFRETVKFFRSVNDHFQDKVEAYVVIAFNEELQEYFMWVPPHKVTMGSVDYNIEEFYKMVEHKNCYIVLDIHLHPGKMGAFFSTTDNKDDCRDRFSGVIGKVYDVIPEFKFRFAAGSKHIEIQIGELFCNDKSDYELDNEKSLKQITISDKHNTKFILGKSGYVPAMGKSLFSMLKEKKDKKFTIAELMGREW